MKITFVGHASVICDLADVTIWMDPWLKGDAFNESWALYPRPELRAEDLARVTHIWISHEHPDHLSIPTLKGIPAEHKARITVLFQKHYDAEVVNWLRSQGFGSVRELPHGAWVELNKQCKVACYQVGHLDSALAICGDNRTILNLNDCDLPDSSIKRLAEQLGPVDLLLDQFSVAGWCGNHDDPERRREAADGVLDRFVRDVEIFRPRFILPFASFVRFSHAENAYMNSSVNSLDSVAEAVDARRLVVMYPGDVWSPADGIAGTAEATSRYRHDWARVVDQPLTYHDVKPIEAVIEAANKRIQDMRDKYHSWALRRVPPVSFYLTDLRQAIVVDLSTDARVADMPEHQCVVSLSSQAAWYAFAMRFGLPTLGVSGRYRINHGEPAFAALKKVGSAYSSGFYTRKIPRFGIGPRLFEFWWRRRRDLVPQFLARLPFLSDGPAQAVQ